MTAKSAPLPGEKYQIKRLEYLDNLSPLCSFEKHVTDCTEKELNARMEFYRVMDKCSEYEREMGL